MKYFLLIALIIGGIRWYFGEISMVIVLFITISGLVWYISPIKIRYFLLIAIAGYLYYLSQTNTIIMNLFGVDQSEIRKPVMYKSIKRINNIDGSYSFSCKKKPRLFFYANDSVVYEVGIEFKYKYLTTTWNTTTKIRKKVGDNNIQMKLKIMDYKKNVIHSEIINHDSLGYGWGAYVQHAVLARVELSKEHCEENLTLTIEYISSKLENMPKDLMYLYVKVDTSI